MNTILFNNLVLFSMFSSLFLVVSFFFIQRLVSVCLFLRKEKIDTFHWNKVKLITERNGVSTI